jgi:predicted small lipoprotein YifL
VPVLHVAKKFPASAAVAAAAALVAGAVLTLAGCGQKGPLYLPDKNATVVGGSVPPPAQSGPAVPAPAPQPQSAPEQTIAGTPPQPVTLPPAAAPPTAAPAPPGTPPKKDDGDTQTPQ